MSYGLKIKNDRGEIVTDGISAIAQYIGRGVGEVNGYVIRSWDVSGVTNSLKTSIIPSVTINWASPYFRRYGDYVYGYNRFWYTLDPVPYYTISVLNVGMGEEDTGGNVYGFKLFGNNSNSIINSNSRTLRWVDGKQFYDAGTTITGVYDNWVIGPTEYDISSLNFKVAPYVIISPTTYSNIVDGAEYSRYALVWYVSKTILYIGSYLLQTDGFEIVIASNTYRMLLLALD